MDVTRPDQSDASYGSALLEIATGLHSTGRCLVLRACSVEAQRLLLAIDATPSARLESRPGELVA